MNSWNTAPVYSSLFKCKRRIFFHLDYFEMKKNKQRDFMIALKLAVVLKHEIGRLSVIPAEIRDLTSSLL